MVSVICLYFGCWPWVEKKAHLDVARFARTETLLALATAQPKASTIKIPIAVWDSHDPLTVIPFVISVCHLDSANIKTPKRAYYVWLFGLKARLPYKGPPTSRSGVNL